MEGIRVPLIISGPGIEFKSKRNEPVRQTFYQL